MSGKVVRSQGVPIGASIVAGGGVEGAFEELDAAVQAAAVALADAFSCDVMIRFNSDRASGGAWLLTDEHDAVGRNSEVGITYSTAWTLLDGSPLPDVEDETAWDEAWRSRVPVGVSRPVVQVSALAARDERSHLTVAADLTEALEAAQGLCWTHSGRALAARVQDERAQSIHRLVMHRPDSDEVADVTLALVSTALPDGSGRYQVKVNGEPRGLMVAQDGSWERAILPNGQVVAESPTSRQGMLTALLGW